MSAKRKTKRKFIRYFEIDEFDFQKSANNTVATVNQKYIRKIMPANTTCDDVFTKSLNINLTHLNENAKTKKIQRKVRFLPNYRGNLVLHDNVSFMSYYMVSGNPREVHILWDFRVE